MNNKRRFRWPKNLLRHLDWAESDTESSPPQLPLHSEEPYSDDGGGNLFKDQFEIAQKQTRFGSFHAINLREL